MLSVHCAGLQSAELGRHFRACASAKATEDRARASQWAARRRHKKNNTQMALDPAVIYQASPKDDDLAHTAMSPLCGSCGFAIPDCCCVRQSKSVTQATISQEPAVDKQRSIQNSRKSSMTSRLSTLARRRSEDASGLMQRQVSDRKKSTEKERPKLKHGFTSRLHRLIQAKQKEFEDLPEEQQRSLRFAFHRAAEEEKPTLGAAQLRQALTDLGLGGRQVHEKEAVQEVIRESIAAGPADFLEFVFQVVPKVEQKLVEAKSPKLLALFNQLDVVMAGSLSCSDCIEALRRHADSFITVLDGDLMEQFWPLFLKELAQQHKVSKHSDDTVDFAHFQRLTSELEVKLVAFQHQMEERAAKVANLPPALEAAHFGEIAVMTRYFQRYAKHHRGLLSTQDLITALLDSGTMPIVGRLHMTTISKLTSRGSKLAVYRFPDFLEAVDNLRREEKSQREAAFRSWYTIHKWQDDRSLQIAELPQLIMDLSLVTDSCRNVLDVRTLVEDCQKSGAETMQFDAAVDLCCKVVESARVAARRREALVAEQVKLSEDQIFDMRAYFAEMTHSGVIGPDDLHGILVELFPDHEIDDVFMQDLLDAALPSGYFHTGTKTASNGLNRPATKESTPSKSTTTQAQDEEAAAQRRALEESILRFDGFLWIVGHLLKSGM